MYDPGMGGTFRVEAVKRYRRPRYPRFGYEIPRKRDRGFWSSLPVERLALVAAGGILSATAAGCYTAGIGNSGYCQDLRLTEAEARTALREAYTQRGYVITEDFEFAQGEVAFTADGYDPVAQVGYDYQSFEERQEDFETPTEAQQVAAWNQDQGPFFLILEERVGCYYPEYGEDGTAQRENLIAELNLVIEDFLDHMEAQGHF